MPARSNLAAYRETAASIGTELMPWQETAARYLMATAPDGRHLYREVAIVVARQNGKTELLVALIVRHLLDGLRVMHTAQNLKLPYEVFERVSAFMSEHHPDQFALRNGKVTKPRFTNGKEEIRLANGGVYSIVAATRGGARGPSRDLVIIDETREFTDYAFIAAAKPTMTASKNPMMVYLSNAGDDSSVVLNGLRARADSDPRLAYLEWSAAPGLAADDLTGWTQSNPSIGFERGGMGPIVETLGDDYRTARLEGTMAIFETEHLCRWVPTMRQALVEVAAWQACEATEPLPRGQRSYMGISMDPAGSRASAAVAWQMADGRIALRLVADVTGDPVDTALIGKEWHDEAIRRRVSKVALDPMTDGELGKFFRVAEPVSGQKWGNASAQFVNLVAAGRLRWADAGALTDDLTWTARKENDERGSFIAVRASDDRPITAVNAAIRAVWLASGPRPAKPQVY